MDKRPLTVEERQILLSYLQGEAFILNECVIDMREWNGDYIKTLDCCDLHFRIIVEILYLFLGMFDCEIEMTKRDGLYTFVSVDGETRGVDSCVEKEEL